MKLTRYLIILLSLFSVSAFAADPAPMLVVKNTTSRMLTELQQHKGQLHNRRVIHDIVRRVVMPQMDVTSIARSVAGRKAWFAASKSEQNEFISLFTRYVIDMYSTSLSSYSDETITFTQMRNFQPSEQRVQIFSSVKRPGKPPIALNYRLINYGSSWKIYDFSVEGVSMVQSYRSQFADTLNKGGLPLLIKQLKERYR